MREPVLSVVIPTYDRARWVAEAIESSLAQAGPPVETIVVDDGSTDQTPRVLARFGASIRVVRQENRGLAAARNAGIRIATGAFVAFLDSDDRLEPTFAARVIETFGEHPTAGAVFVAERVILEDGTRTDTVSGKRTPGPWFSTEGMIARDTGVGCGRPAVVRRELLERLGGFDESFRSAVDCEMWIRWSFDVPMVVLPEPLVLRRLHPGHLSGDRAVNARHWLRILSRLERDRPEFAAAHRDVLRRAVGKENLRLGRERLARAAEDADALAEARSALRRAVSSWPRFGRAWLYLAWSYLAPRGYAAWRGWELRKRRRNERRRGAVRS